MTTQEQERCAVLWEGDNVSVVTPKKYDYESLVTKDQVFVVPFLLKEKKFLIRKELIPSYSIRESSQEDDLWYTIISEAIEGSEDSLEHTVVRAMTEKAGIVFDLDDDMLFTIQEGPIPLMKGLTAKVTIYLLVLGDYYQVTPKKGNSYIERNSETIACTIDDVNNILQEGKFDFLFLTGMNMIMKTLDIMMNTYLEEKGKVKDE